MFSKWFLDGDREYRRSDNSNLVEQSCLDDDRRYVVRGYFPFIPNIRDGRGNIVMPHEYERTFEDGCMMMVNVKPRMYVFIFYFYFLFWESLNVERVFLKAQGC